MKRVVLLKQSGGNVKPYHMAAAYKKMIEHNDHVNAHKLLDLYSKQRQKQTIISFAGHFSAGKSSMINALLGEDILPKSPIPTSANIVRITSGEGVARIYFKDQEPVEYSEPYDIDQIKAYSKDKSSIKQIDISTSDPIIPENCFIVDTPGIDAADDADRVMTEGSMHLADAVFYVMDYNHVQSEVNLNFLKGLQEQAIPFDIIINQIDKHDENELSFSDYQQRIESTFTQWGLEPERVFYSSLTERELPYNMYDDIQAHLVSFMTRDYEAVQNTDAAFKQIIDAHKLYLDDRYKEKEQELTAFDASSFDDTQLNRLNERITQLKQQPFDIESALIFEVQQTLKNAYLMPAQTRETAKAFLISRQPNFKVGFIASKKKTEDEQANRLHTFLTELHNNMQTTIQWRLRDKLTDILKTYDMNDADLLQKLQDIHVTYTDSDVLHHVNTGANVNGQYVLNFTNDVANGIKQQFKQQVMEIIDAVKVRLESVNKLLLQQLLQEKREMERMYDEQQHIKALHHERQQAHASLDAILYTNTTDETSLNDIEEALKHRHVSFIKRSGTALNSLTLKENVEHVIHSEAGQPIVDQSVARSGDVISHVEQTIALVENMPGFDMLVADLQRKSARLEQQTYTISLFGAFSSGKSTFANALLGESVLPMSPNPTTASVNRINPVCAEYPHGTVIIHVKDEATLKQDVLMMANTFSLPEDDFGSMVKWIEQIDLQHNLEISSVYRAHLQALLTGYSEMEGAIGQTLSVSIDEFPRYVADETYASYIEAIDLYYDCELTQKGITLVDTPGADSVNARHTSVAFDYIKQADAILYVTYYNHALSRADKTFLTQLGRVKDTFELDKMFFLVNAADLAVDENELKLVTSYVDEQLVKLGIRQARLYPVSSKQSLNEKINGEPSNQNMQQFEHDFKQFIEDDLTAIISQSTYWDIQRAHSSMMTYMNTVKMNQTEKQALKDTLAIHYKHAQKKVDQLGTDVQAQQIRLRIDKQIYYVWERVSIQYHDRFKEAFNPTTITDSGKDARHQLNHALRQLVDEIAFELLQELRAVSLRVEATAKKLAETVYMELIDSCQQIDSVFTFPAYDSAEMNTPEYEAAFQAVDMAHFQKALALFKNTKRFFVDHEKDIMKNQIYEQLQPLAMDYLETNKAVMNEHYMREWEQRIQSIKQTVMSYLDHYVNSQLTMMSSSVDTEEIKQTLSKLEHILSDEKR
ncbi:dynamin family protein [Lentibacillus saliphilus]|uniref:dynamin family protein n=1 Tax=Lentibacillus saliphilus TaxID=2737028 RepID=UPI001C30F6E5|nr:dynamin family protein [Lentibacillus saliphilus]